MFHAVLIIFELEISMLHSYLIYLIISRNLISCLSFWSLSPSNSNEINKTINNKILLHLFLLAFKETLYWTNVSKDTRLRMNVFLIRYTLLVRC